MRLDRDGGELIIKIRLTEEGCYKSPTRGAVYVTDQLGLILGSEDDKPRIWSPVLDQRGMFDRELKRRVNGLCKLVAVAEVSASDDVEPVGLGGVVCTRILSVYLRVGGVSCIHGRHSSTWPLRLVKRLARQVAEGRSIDEGVVGEGDVPGGEIGPVIG